MVCTLPWYSLYVSDFNTDFEVTLEHEGELVERPGLSCFLRIRERVFHTYSTYERGLDGLGSTTSLLDLTALGRREPWEKPEGRASSSAPAAAGRVRYHDEYEDQTLGSGNGRTAEAPLTLCGERVRLRPAASPG
ncbi:hypothetical protein STENM327S_09371 [Streptomyces tendae]